MQRFEIILNIGIDAPSKEEAARMADAMKEELHTFTGAVYRAFPWCRDAELEIEIEGPLNV